MPVIHDPGVGGIAVLVLALTLAVFLASILGLSLLRAARRSLAPRARDEEERP